MMVWRDRSLVALAVLGSSLLLLVMVMMIWREAGSTNAYAVVAESFLNGTPYNSACFGVDCVTVEGKNYVVFPPMPGVLAMPLVWLGGIHTKGFMALSLLLFAGSLWIWNLNFKFLEVEKSSRYWLLAALGFASPLYYVALRGDGIWFFAQSTAFFFLSLAVYEAMVRGSLFTAGLALGAAFLSRQLTIFLAPFLYFLWLNKSSVMTEGASKKIVGLIKFAIPLAAAAALYLAYNYWRFGDPLETGYRYLIIDQGGPLTPRLFNYGLWNKSYALFNFMYLLVQGFHAEFAQPAYVTIQSLDSFGTSFLAASPWIVLLFFMRINTVSLIALATMLGLTTIQMFYHSNGFSQYNVQRYVLDWLPAILVVLAPALTQIRLEWVRLLIVWGISLNVVTVVILAMTR